MESLRSVLLDAVITDSLLGAIRQNTADKIAGTASAVGDYALNNLFRSGPSLGNRAELKDEAVLDEASDLIQSALMNPGSAYQGALKEEVFDQGEYRYVVEL